MAGTRRTASIASAALVALAAAGTASAAAKWLPATSMVATGAQSQPMVGVDNRGNAYVAWVKAGPLSVVRRHPAGGVWKPEEPIGAGYLVAFAVTGTGRAFAMTSEATGVRIRTRAPGGAWAQGKFLGSVLSPTVATGAGGKAVAVWLDTFGGRVRATVWRNGSWGPVRTVVDLAPTRLVFGASAVMDAKGLAAVGWRESASGGLGCGLPPCYANGRSTVAVLKSGARKWKVRNLDAWDATESFSTLPAPIFAFDGNGNLLAGWNAVGNPYRTRRRSAAGSWGPIRAVADAIPNLRPSMAVAGSGRATVAWPLLQSVQVSNRAPGAGSGWSSELGVGNAFLCTLPCGFVATFPVLTARRAGRTIILWIQRDMTNYRPYARIRNGTTWGPIVPLAAPANMSGLTPVTEDQAGNALVAWMPQPGGLGVAVAALDAAGPVARGLKAPRKAQAGHAVRFKVNPFDVWSDVQGKPVWKFGDGKTAKGKSVKHTYASAGTKTVKLTLRDEHGNKTVVKRRIVVG